MEWKPIESAPVEEDILVFVKTHQGAKVFTAALYRDRDGYGEPLDMPLWDFISMSSHGVSFSGLLDANPTHWMPLPTPPEAE